MNYNKINIEKIFLIVFLLLALVPFFVQAQRPLVPCGGPGQPACQICHIFVLINNIIRFLLFTILPPLAVLLLVIGGFMFLFAGASENTLKQAKSIIFSTIFGLIIILSAWIIVNTLLAQTGIIRIERLLEWHDIGCP